MDKSKSYRVIKSGHTVEIYQYEKLNYRVEKDEKKVDKNAEKKVDDAFETNKEHNRIRNDHRARQEVRRLINSNWLGEKNEYFITLTYAENFKDTDRAYKDFQGFIKNLKRRYDANFKYLAVMEWQKRGAIHFHCILKGNFDIGHELDAVENEWHKTMWKHGFTKIKSLWAIDNIGAYLTKELMKDIQKQEREEGKNRYYRSQNLDKQEVIEGEDAEYWIDTLMSLYPTFTNSYESVYTGKVQYREYNLERMRKEGQFK